MSDNTLKNILTKYDQKREASIRDLEIRKRNLYFSNKDLELIENQLTSFSIEISKSIINANKEIKKNLIIELEKKITELKNKKLSILKKLNIEPSFLEPYYECEKCQDTGYISDKYGSKMCACLRQELLNNSYGTANLGNISKDNFDNFNHLLYSDKINEEKYNSDISPRKNIEDIKETCLNFIDNFDNPEEKNLLFIGSPGLGKTFLSNCIAKELLERGKTVLYQTTPVLLDLIMNYKFNKGNISTEMYQNIFSVDLLIIDDLGTESINNLKFSELFTIINTRLLNQNNKITKTIISTNLSLNAFMKTYDDRFVSRIVGHYNIGRFFGDDIRFKK